MSDYEKLQKLITETEGLIQRRDIVPSDPTFQAWSTIAERVLIQIFGKDSLEHTKFKETNFKSLSFNSLDMILKCREGLYASKFIFETYLTELSDSDASVGVPAAGEVDLGKVFIVHGHDDGLKQAVARLVEKQGLTAIILNEQANQGNTIIEKFVANSDVSGAICLFTADDVGYAKTDADTNTHRARQNVVFEAGYFMGKLGRDRVVIIAERNIELPSDMQGVVYTDSQNWEVDVLKELKAMGYKIDFNKLYN